MTDRGDGGIPGTANEWSRRALINAVRSLHQHRAALTVVGAHAVILRTQDLTIEPSATADADFSVTPELVADTSIEVTLVGEGYELRAAQGVPPSRPGQWGRGRIIQPDGSTSWTETVDLLAGRAIAGNVGKRTRGVPALSAVHGKMSVGNAEGVELCSYDRSPLLVTDLTDPSDSLEVNVAGYGALLIAKAYKISERLDGNPARLRAKDSGDVWRLLEACDLDQVQGVLDEHSDHPTIGPAVRKGIGHLRRVIASPVVVQMAAETYAFDLTVDEIGATFHRAGPILGG